jgi:hypothetical protein
MTREFEDVARDGMKNRCFVTAIQGSQDVVIKIHKA